MTIELLLAIAALCAEPGQNRVYCKTMLIGCVQESATKDADVAAKCYWDEYMTDNPWMPKTTAPTEQTHGRCH